VPNISDHLEGILSDEIKSEPSSPEFEKYWNDFLKWKEANENKIKVHRADDIIVFVRELQCSSFSLACRGLDSGTIEG
jgi:hypothetical protein